MKISEVSWKKNFCHVFELPNEFPSGFCFNPIPVEFRMVDWFQPIPDKEICPEEVPKNWEELEDKLRAFLKGKSYIRPGYHYILITDFGKSFVFKKE